MKTRFAALTLATCVSLAAHTVLAQTTVSTVPVGFISTTLAAASNSTTPTTAIVGIPFYGSPNGSATYAGAISTVDSSGSFSISSSAATSAGWAPTQFSSGAPYLARIKTSANSSATGLFFVITGNTTQQITVATNGLNLTTLLAANDTFEIDPANTLGSAFGTQPPSPGNGAGTSGVVSLMTDDSYPATDTTMVQTAASTADNVLLYNSSNGNWTTYFFYSNPSNANYNVPNGSGKVTNPAWHTASGGLATSPSQNPTIIYPDEAVFVRHRSTINSCALVFSGTVPSTQEQSALPTPGSTLLANRFPTDTTLAGLGLQNVSNWLSGTASSTTDNVLIYNPSTAGWATYFYYSNPSNGNYGGATNPAWHTSSGGLATSPSQNPTVIPAGSAVFVRRISTAAPGAATTVIWSLPYSLN